MDCTDSNCTQW